ncbi:MAG: hypothetical protein A2Y33_01115 [Spirochaetes bacterium GWF1_51_8]|nr:MAG: hypothetical protein A2Y33_01115 [Spirochaetes bacterium GWF1_51_8]
MRIYFIRHGESEANIQRVFSNRDVKHDLTEKGRTQTEELAVRLNGISFAGFYTSPVYRALRTAEILRNRLNLPEPCIDEGLREFDVGIFEGRSDEQSWMEHKTLWEDWLVRGEYEKRHPEGENHYDIRERFGKWLDAAAGEFGKRDVNILAVTHGALMMCALPFALKNLTPGFTFNHLLSNTAIVTAEEREDGFYCMQWDTLKIETDGSVV